MKLLVVLSASLSFTAAAVTFDQFDAAGYVAANVITRDIAVIGGGATGTYAAIKLGDLGKSVVLVEKAGRLGVSAYFNNSIVTDFFAKFHVPVVNFSFASSATPIFADFAAATIPANFTPSGLLPARPRASRPPLDMAGLHPKARVDIHPPAHSIQSTWLGESLRYPGNLLLHVHQRSTLPGTARPRYHHRTPRRLRALPQSSRRARTQRSPQLGRHRCISPQEGLGQARSQDAHRQQAHHRQAGRARHPARD